MRIDIDLHFQPHPLTGDLPLKRGNQATVQSMKNLILTNYYERGFNVEVYSNVNGSLFENDVPLLRQTLEQNIRRVLKSFEPYVEVVRIDMKGGNDNTLDIIIYYNEYYNPNEQSFVVTLNRLR